MKKKFRYKRGEKPDGRIVKFLEDNIEVNKGFFSNRLDEDVDVIIEIKENGNDAQHRCTTLNH